MKNRKIVKSSIGLLTPLALALGVFVGLSSNKPEEAKGYSVSSLPTTIELNDSSDSTIRSYYSSLNNLSQSERQGNNLLKNLKTILKNGQKYYSYDSTSSIWQMYEITDRDWDKSPASSTTYGTYNSSTNTITNYTYGTSASSSKNNPYIHALYINRNIENKTTAWDDHQQTEWGINREHVWPKAEGFETSGAGGARGDPMHLMAGNGYSNNIHSNFYYGYVNTSSSYTDCGSKYSNQSGNLRGTSSTLGGSTSVFEPQDCDKGDIARAIFYMVARYNYLSGSDSDGIDSNNPNLALTQSLSDWASSGYSSTTSKQGKMGIMTDLLNWHHNDPVDEYEKHRNNLLYTNFTNNRNPFIDFPEWADFIWGTATYNGKSFVSYSSNPTGYASPSTDTINGYNSGSSTVDVTGVSLNKDTTTIRVGETETLTATVAPSNATNKGVSWLSSNNNVATVSNGVVSAIANGTATITVTTTDGGFTASCTVTVTSGSIAVTAVNLDSNSETLDVSETVTLTATVLPTNATNKNVTWTSSNTSVTTVSNGVVTAVATGTATITATSAADSTKKATCEITVKSADYILTYSNTPFTPTSYGASATASTKTTNGIIYESQYGYNYSGGQQLSFSYSNDGYLQNNTAYSNDIRKIVMTYAYDMSGSGYEDTYMVYEGATAGSQSTETEISLSADGKTVTYSCSGDYSYFKYVQKATGSSKYYINIVSIKIYLEESSGAVKTLSSITASGYKTNFNVGDEFSFGGTVTATYSDSSYENVTSLATFNGYNMSSVGTQTVTVSYTENDVAKTTTYQITVSQSVTPEDGVVTLNIQEYAQAHSWVNGTQYSSIEMNEVVTISVSGGSNTGKYYTNGYEWRTYQGESATVTLTAATGYNITYVIFTYNVANTGILKYNDVSKESGVQIDLNLQTATFSVGNSGSATNGQVKFTNIEVGYEEESVFTNKQYSLVTDLSDLRTGDTIVFVGNKNSTYYAATALNNDRYRTETVTKNSNDITIDSALPFTIVRNDNYFSFCHDNLYMAAKSKSGTYVSEESSITNDSRFTLTLSNNAFSIVANGDATYKYFRYNSSNSWFTFHSGTSGSSAVYIYKQKIQIAADTWSKTFLSSTSDGTNCNVNNWEELSTSYKALDTKVRKEIAEVEANASTDYSYRAQAMARYDYLMSDSRFNDVEHFITGRTVSSSSRPIDLIHYSNDNVTIIVILVSIISVSSLGCLCVIKKKRAGLR